MSKMLASRTMGEIRETLKRLRDAKGVNVAQLCKETGIKEPTYYTYEKEGRWPSQENIIKLSDYFECSVDRLVKGYETPHYHLAKAMHHFHHYFKAIKNDGTENDEGNSR